MAAPEPLPKYIYKILPSPPQDPLPQEFPLSQLDANDGFVHLSTATQVLEFPTHTASLRTELHLDKLHGLRCYVPQCLIR